MERIKRMPQERLVLFYFLFFAFAAIFSIIYFNGTAHEADSITHYLYAKFAFDNPRLYFNHWAKPVFVLLASPFAQLGFVGMKIFNSILAMFNFLLVYRIANRLKYRNPHLSIFFLIFCPLYFVVIFSGLTEILFASFILFGIYLILKEKPAPAAIVISFLPFVRSEGLFFIALFAIYFILSKQWKFIFYLAVGHAVYAIAGVFVFNNALWVVTDIPYAHLGSPYGKGKLFHFAEQLQYVIGIPLYILFWVGILENIRKIIRKSFRKRHRYVDIVLVFFGFATFFIAHTLFWYFGIFNSMGLKRVMVGVAPLAILICLQGFNYITENLLCNKGKLRKVIRYGFILYIFIFPFTSNPAAINWKKDMWHSVSQDLVQEKIAKYIQARYTEIPRLVYNDYFISEALSVEHFNPNKRIDLSKDYLNELKEGDLIIWDSWHSVVDRNTNKEDLDSNPQFKLIKEFTEWDKNRQVIYALYEVQ